MFISKEIWAEITLRNDKLKSAIKVEEANTSANELTKLHETAQFKSSCRTLIEKDIANDS